MSSFPLLGLLIQMVTNLVLLLKYIDMLSLLMFLEFLNFVNSLHYVIEHNVSAFSVFPFPTSAHLLNLDDA